MKNSNVIKYFVGPVIGCNLGMIGALIVLVFFSISPADGRLLELLIITPTSYVVVASRVAFFVIFAIFAGLGFSFLRKDRLKIILWTITGGLTGVVMSLISFFLMLFLYLSFLHFQPMIIMLIISPALFGSVGFFTGFFISRGLKLNWIPVALIGGISGAIGNIIGVIIDTAHPRILYLGLFGVNIIPLLIVGTFLGAGLGLGMYLASLKHSSILK